MAVHAPGDVPPGPDEYIDLPWWEGGGKGFGLGGFPNTAQITGPASGPAQGISLGQGGAAASSGPDITDVFSRLRGFLPGGGGALDADPYWRDPKWTGAHIDPATGQPEMLTGPGSISETNQKTLGHLNPFGFVGRGNPYWRGVIAGAGAIAPTPAETGELSPRFFTGQGVQPGLSAPQGTPYEVPRGMPGRAVAPPASYPHMPWPGTGVAPAANQPAGAPAIGSPAPAVPPVRPGPAAARQRPNLGAYNPLVQLPYRPNAPAEGGGRGGGGPPVATALDLSKLFQRRS